MSGTVSGVGTGENFTCALKAGVVSCWGKNWFGQLGDGTFDTRFVPAPVPGLDGVSAISVGGGHACAIKDGGVWCWGSNHSGQLGRGVGGPAFASPAQVVGMASGVTAIAGGHHLTCAIKDGGAWCWGENAVGGLGDGTTDDSNVPVAVTGFGSGVSLISAGAYHACGVKDGALSCWGKNQYGELGDGTETIRLVPTPVVGLAGTIGDIELGANHSCAVVDGAAWCWGSNFDGQLGDGTTTDSNVPVAVSGMASGVSAVEAGTSHTCVVQTGVLWCWGDNGWAEIGDDTTTSSSVPVISRFSNRDGDGCTDAEELSIQVGSGGDRDPLSEWDFYDVPSPSGPMTGADGKPILSAMSAQNKTVSLVDVGVVLTYVGRTASNPAYIADNNGDGVSDGVQLDRTPSANMAKPWQSGPPSGAISLVDVGIVLKQVGHNCAVLP
jgi:alpha-tubulin suppressor-like RCC1 family protein